jgi:uncharacterized protein (DUF433 family)
MDLGRLKRITVEEGKCGGRPCIRGLRIRVSDVLDLLAAGASYEEILADYPFLEREDISRGYRVRRPAGRSHCPHDLVRFLIHNQLPGALSRFLTSLGYRSWLFGTGQFQSESRRP